MRVLAIAGSLRLASINAAFCRLAARLASAPLHVEVYGGLGSLPLFNPELEADPPAAVRELRALVGQADALLIASPEYAHGVSGVMKNALDWLVSDEGFVGKPVALVNTSPRAHHAYAALRETLQTMSARLVVEAVVPLLGHCKDEQGMRADAPTVAATQRLLADLAMALQPSEAQGPSFRF